MVSYTLKQIISSAKKHPDRIAYKVNDEQITYSQLISESEKNAGFLIRQGSSPVVLIGHKSVGTVIAMISCLIARRAYVPVENSVPTARIKSIINAVGSTLIISEQPYDFDQCECCHLDELRKFSAFPEKKNENTTAYIIFTSGSTGEPKGVPVSYGNLDNFCRWISSLYPLNEYRNAAVLNHASFSFDLSVADFYYSMCNSHTLVGLTNDVKSDLNRCIEIIRTENVNVMVMTPTGAKLYLLDKSFNAENLPSLKCIYFCGEILETKTSQKLLNAFPNLNIINAYGPTEATSAVSASLINRYTADNENVLPVGDADSFATAIEIIDNEIVLKGKSVFGGYLGIKSDKCFCENGVNCFKTGDNGYIENGKLYCCGRRDRQIKYMGYRIELEDIENNLSKIDGVESCAVIAKLNSDSVVRKITAFVVPSDTSVSDELIKNRLKALLPEYMIPKTIKILEELPINQNGKIDRKALSLL